MKILCLVTFNTRAVPHSRCSYQLALDWCVRHARVTRPSPLAPAALRFSSRSSASKRSGFGVSLTAHSFLTLAVSYSVLERAMASVCIIGSGNWWVPEKSTDLFKETWRTGAAAIFRSDEGDVGSISTCPSRAHADVATHICLPRVCSDLSSWWRVFDWNSVRATRQDS